MYRPLDDFIYTNVVKKSVIFSISLYFQILMNIYLLKRNITIASQ